MSKNRDLSFVDHIAVACTDLEEGVRYIESLLGVKSSIGGVHPGFGTKNHLIKLGERCFLEIIGPDPDRSCETLPHLFMIDQVSRPTLTRWIASSNDLLATKMKCDEQNIDIGEISSAQRQKPDGSFIQWKLSDPYKVAFDGLMPFFIDWGDSAHPAEGLDQPCRLIKLESYYKNEKQPAGIFQSLNIAIPVHQDNESRLVATIESPKGLVQIF